MLYHIDTHGDVINLFQRFKEVGIIIDISMNIADKDNPVCKKGDTATTEGTGYLHIQLKCNYFIFSVCCCAIIQFHQGHSLSIYPYLPKTAIV